MCGSIWDSQMCTHLLAQEVLTSSPRVCLIGRIASQVGQAESYGGTVSEESLCLRRFPHLGTQSYLKSHHGITSKC